MGREGEGRGEMGRAVSVSGPQFAEWGGGNSLSANSPCSAVHIGGASAMYCTALCYNALQCTVIQSTALHCTVLQCTTMYYPASNYLLDALLGTMRA